MCTEQVIPAVVEGRLGQLVAGTRLRLGRQASECAGETRSSLGTNSSVMTRPLSVKLRWILRSRVSQAAVEK